MKRVAVAAGGEAEPGDAMIQNSGRSEDDTHQKKIWYGRQKEMVEREREIDTPIVVRMCVWSMECVWAVLEHPRKGPHRE